MPPKFDPTAIFEGTRIIYLVLCPRISTIGSQSSDQVGLIHLVKRVVNDLLVFRTFLDSHYY